MNLIQPHASIIEERDPFKKIELAGRTCYKSEKSITGESAVKFYNSLVERKHTAMLEHATFVFQLGETEKNVYELCEKSKYLNTAKRYFATGGPTRYLVSGNLRAINESGISALLYCLYKYNPRLVYNPLLYCLYTKLRIQQKTTPDCTLVEIDDEAYLTHNGKRLLVYPLSEKEFSAHKYTSMRFICDRGVSHELVRHRPCSFAQESTRYVNYAKTVNVSDGMNFIEPADYENWSDALKTIHETTLATCERAYNEMIAAGATPQMARADLPNAIKTEVVITTNHAEWKHFFNLRSKGTTGAPHPDMKKVADIALDCYKHYVLGGLTFEM